MLKNGANKQQIDSNGRSVYDVLQNRGEEKFLEYIEKESSVVEFGNLVSTARKNWIKQRGERQSLYLNHDAHLNKSWARRILFSDDTTPGNLLC